jgi:hypothetical protein
MVAELSARRCDGTTGGYWPGLSLRESLSLPVCACGVLNRLSTRSTATRVDNRCARRDGEWGDQSIRSLPIVRRRRLGAIELRVVNGDGEEKGVPWFRSEVMRINREGIVVACVCACRSTRRSPESVG